MAKVNITLPDEIADRVRVLAGEGKMSEYIARAVRNRLVEDELRALADFEAAHGGPDLGFELGWEQGAA